MRYGNIKRATIAGDIIFTHLYPLLAVDTTIAECVCGIGRTVTIRPDNLRPRIGTGSHHSQFALLGIYCPLFGTPPAGDCHIKRTGEVDNAGLQVGNHGGDTCRTKLDRSKTQLREISTFRNTQHDASTYIIDYRLPYLPFHTKPPLDGLLGTHHPLIILIAAHIHHNRACKVMHSDSKIG